MIMKKWSARCKGTKKTTHLRSNFGSRAIAAPAQPVNDVTFISHKMMQPITGLSRHILYMLAVTDVLHAQKLHVNITLICSVPLQP